MLKLGHIHVKITTTWFKVGSDGGHGIEEKKYFVTLDAELCLSKVDRLPYFLCVCNSGEFSIKSTSDQRAGMPHVLQSIATANKSVGEIISETKRRGISSIGDQVFVLILQPMHV